VSPPDTDAFTANPISGSVPLIVSFVSAGVDYYGHVITNWNWTFGDGSTSTAQNPSHAYTNAGIFSPALIATNNLGGTVTGSGPASITVTNGPAYSGLVLNGGFETGDFTGWTVSGAVSNILDVFVDNGSQSGIKPLSGGYLAALGPVGSLSYLSQTVATSAGAAYLLSLWLDSPDGQTPNEFLVSWNGNTLFDETNIPAIGWTNLQFWVAATATNTVLSFGFRDDPGYLGLDDVSVAPASFGMGSVQVSGTNLVLAGTNGLAGGTYYVLTSTNLLLPLSQWTRVATNILSTSGNFTTTVTNTVTSGAGQRFYILQLQ
jgi:PKD repeat protein